MAQTKGFVCTLPHTGPGFRSHRQGIPCSKDCTRTASSLMPAPGPFTDRVYRQTRVALSTPPYRMHLITRLTSAPCYV